MARDEEAEGVRKVERVRLEDTGLLFTANERAEVRAILAIGGVADLRHEHIFRIEHDAAKWSTQPAQLATGESFENAEADFADPVPHRLRRLDRSSP